MVKLSFGDIDLSKMFLGLPGTDRTCKTLDSYSILKCLNASVHESYINLRTNLADADVEKIGRIRQ